MVMTGIGRGRASRVKGLEPPCPRKSSSSVSSAPDENETSVDVEQQLHYLSEKLVGGVSLPDVLSLQQLLHEHGAQLDKSNPGMVEDVFMSVRLYAQSRTHSGAIRARLLSLLELRANGWMKSNATELYYSKKIHDLSIKEKCLRVGAGNKPEELKKRTTRGRYESTSESNIQEDKRTTREWCESNIQRDENKKPSTSGKNRKLNNRRIAPQYGQGLSNLQISKKAPVVSPSNKTSFAMAQFGRGLRSLSTEPELVNVLGRNGLIAVSAPERGDHAEVDDLITQSIDNFEDLEITVRGIQCDSEAEAQVTGECPELDDGRPTPDESMEGDPQLDDVNYSKATDDVDKGCGEGKRSPLHIRVPRSYTRQTEISPIRFPEIGSLPDNSKETAVRDIKVTMRGQVVSARGSKRRAARHRPSRKVTFARPSSHSESVVSTDGSDSEPEEHKKQDDDSLGRMLQPSVVKKMLYGGVTHMDQETASRHLAVHLQTDTVKGQMIFSVTRADGRVISNQKVFGMVAFVTNTTITKLKDSDNSDVLTLVIRGEESAQLHAVQLLRERCEENDY